MSTTTEIPKGYKHTKIGVFPEDWTLNSVGKALIIENNKRKPISEEERKLIQGHYPYYGPTKIQDFLNEYHYVGDYALIAEDGDHFLKYRDHSMTQMASGKFNVNNHAHALKGTDECLTKWFFWFYNRRNIYSHITRQGAGRYKLNKAALQQLQIAYPEIPEQAKIIETLDTWDKAISNTQTIIDQLKLRNKGLAQQLLSGKKRLNGFVGNWHKDRLGNILKEVKNVPVENPEQYELITIKLYGKGIYASGKSPKTTKSGRTYHFRYAGEIIVGRQNFHNGSIALMPEFQNKMIASNAISSFSVVKGFNRGWILNYLLRPIFYSRVENLIGGTGQKEINRKDFNSIPIIVPPLEEQLAIVSILETANQELKLYEKKLATLKEQKKGLMQKLLTGEIRVKVDG